jgi:hypothetical protein
MVVGAYRLEADLDGGLDVPREVVDLEPLAALAMIGRWTPNLTGQHGVS